MVTLFCCAFMFLQCLVLIYNNHSGKSPYDPEGVGATENPIDKINKSSIISHELKVDETLFYRIVDSVAFRSDLSDIHCLHMSEGTLFLHFVSHM